MGNPLELLRVIDRLEIGPPRLEPRALVAPYRVSRGKRSDTFDLIYRYAEDVFDPPEAVSQNLAAMVAAQVGVNYGLFCEEIVFHGAYDQTDREFLQEMAENTAREIYVKKFLEPNPFLVGPAREMTPVQRKSYLPAALKFSDAGRGQGIGGEPWSPATPERTRHAVLSSGGKESLLSYALLAEMGRPTDPIFVNESGRHWFTALNAFRHLSATWPGTARVWTSSDRVFNGMLRHLPFIRPDFASIRADEYAIRLWTMAVFIFGALPLLRRRQIGRLVVGNEYDTTRRLTHRDIPHYDGLYDQSRYFDEAMTRYYGRKGWGIRQFSVVRHLSEFLVQEILAQRYPDLQRHQVSCHATHVEEGRVRPCGRCEKCRRVVGLLRAVDADPAACGYTPPQIAACLEALAASRFVQQEAAGVQHLLWLLSRKGLIPVSSPGGAAARARPEIEKLRFHPDQAPVDSVPEDLREPLYGICLQHAHGAVKRHGRSWVAAEVQSFLQLSAKR